MPSNKKSTNSNKSGISRNIKGKNYELIDIENLVRANKELSKQIELQNQFIKKQDKRIAKGKELLRGCDSPVFLHRRTSDVLDIHHTVRHTSVHERRYAGKGSRDTVAEI